MERNVERLAQGQPALGKLLLNVLYRDHFKRVVWAPLVAARLLWTLAPATEADVAPSGLQ